MTDNRSGEPTARFAGFRAVSDHEDRPSDAARRRKIREDHIPVDFCDGPGWNILLALHSSSDGITVADTLRQSFAPPRTAQRVLDYLADSGLIERGRGFGQFQRVKLSAEGFRRMDAYFNACGRTTE